MKFAALGAKALTEKGDDSVFQSLAPNAPALGADELFYTVAQVVKAHYPRGVPHLESQLIPQAWKEEQLTAIARFFGQTAQV